MTLLLDWKTKTKYDTVVTVLQSYQNTLETETQSTSYKTHTRELFVVITIGSIHHSWLATEFATKHHKPKTKVTWRVQMWSRNDLSFRSAWVPRFSSVLVGLVLFILSNYMSSRFFCCFCCYFVVFLNLLLHHASYYIYSTLNS